MSSSKRSFPSSMRSCCFSSESINRSTSCSRSRILSVVFGISPTVSLTFMKLSEMRSNVSCSDSWLSVKRSRKRSFDSLASPATSPTRSTASYERVIADFARSKSRSAVCISDSISGKFSSSSKTASLTF